MSGKDSARSSQPQIPGLITIDSTLKPPKNGQSRAEKASFITGAVLSVDGGNSIGTYEPGMIDVQPFLSA